MVSTPRLMTNNNFFMIRYAKIYGTEPGNQNDGDRKRFLGSDRFFGRGSTCFMLRASGNESFLLTGMINDSNDLQAFCFGFECGDPGNHVTFQKTMKYEVRCGEGGFDFGFVGQDRAFG